MLASKIESVGGYVPERRVTNHDLEVMLNTTDDWIVQRTGIHARHWVHPEQSTSDLALEASRIAIEKAKIPVSAIDMIVFATSFPDTDLPGAASFLHAKLGMKNVPYFEIRQACSGFVYALSLADQFIRTGHKQCILVVGAEVQSKVMDLTPNGRNTSVLFGDGAGAVVVTRTDVKDPAKDPHIMATELYADGENAENLIIPAPGSRHGAKRISHELIDQGLIYPQMNGRAIFTYAVTRMPEALKTCAANAKIELNQVDRFFFHQANIRINEKVAENCLLPAEKIHNTIHKFGNTTSATIPLGMWDAELGGRLKKGDLVGMAAFGGGLTWGAGFFRY